MTTYEEEKNMHLIKRATTCLPCIVYDLVAALYTNKWMFGFHMPNQTASQRNVILYASDNYLCIKTSLLHTHTHTHMSRTSKQTTLFILIRTKQQQTILFYSLIIFDSSSPSSSIVVVGRPFKILFRHRYKIFMWFYRDFIIIIITLICKTYQT